MIEPMQADSRFLADVAAAPRELPEGVHLWWLGQSGYLLRHRQTTVLIDPYLSDSLTAKYANSTKPHVRMHRRVVAPAELGRALGAITLITSSHGHTDHLDALTLQPLLSSTPVEAMVAPRAIGTLVRERLGSAPVGMQLTQTSEGESWTARDLKLTAIASAHDLLERDAAGNCLYLGYVLRIGGKAIYHSGDTVMYDGLAERVRALRPIDLAILPINGKVGNMGGRDAAQLAKAMGARLVIPCHYDMFEFNTADPKEEFIPECERIGQAYRVLQLGERLTM